MENKKEMTALNVSAATDTKQPIQKCTDDSIPDYDENTRITLLPTTTPTSRGRKTAWKALKRKRAGKARRAR